MIRTVIVDDEPLARAGLRAQLLEHPDIAVVAEYADYAAACSGIAAEGVELLLLDIQMPGGSGMQLLHGVPARHRPATILLTAHAQHALDAFALDAVDYLLKPLDGERLAEALTRARRRLGRSLPLVPNATTDAAAAYSRRFQIRVGDVIRYVDADALRWLQADGDYVWLHAGDGRHLHRETLSRMQELLNPQRFVRVHRSSIVRLDVIAELRCLSNRDALLRLDDGALVRASRSHVERLRTMLASPCVMQRAGQRRQESAA